MDDTRVVKKSLLRWRLLRWGLIGLAALVTIVALLVVEENWRGKRAWGNYKHEWEAKGEKFDLKDFIPPPVPDDENFTMTPFLAPLFDFAPNPKPGESPWRDTNAHQKVTDFGFGKASVDRPGSWTRAQRTDLTAWAKALDCNAKVPAAGESPAERARAAVAVLQQMKKFDPVLEELRTASRRPYCRFNIGYTNVQPVAILLPHLAVVKILSTMYCLRSSAEVAAGQTDGAMGDIKMSFYLADGIKDEPALISGLVRIAIINIALQPIWEGLADHRWSEAQLKDLQGQLGRFDMLAEYGHVMRGERAFGNTEIDYQRKSRTFQTLNAGTLLPSGWFYQNQLTINRMYQQLMLPEEDVRNHRIRVDLITQADAQTTADLNKGFSPYTIFARMLLPAVVKTSQKYARTQVYLDEALIACALERYRLAHGEYPEKLDALSPQYIEKIPTDVITGEPLKYRKSNDGQFILYSVGWNGVDDGGKIVMGNGTTPPVDFTQGDWVWRY